MTSYAAFKRTSTRSLYCCKYTKSVSCYGCLAVIPL